MKCFHGTTLENFREIINGSQIKQKTAWTCSDNDGCFYVYTLDKIAKESGYSYTDIENIVNDGIQRAFESAQITASYNSKDTKLVVLELEIDKDMLDDDYSCENMQNLASYISISDFNTNMIKKVYVCEFNAWYSPFVLSQITINEYFNKWECDEKLLEYATILFRKDIFIDDIYEFNYKETNVNCLL